MEKEVRDEAGWKSGREEEEDEMEKEEVVRDEAGWKRGREEEQREGADW